MVFVVLRKHKALTVAVVIAYVVYLFIYLFSFCGRFGSVRSGRYYSIVVAAQREECVFAYCLCYSILALIECEISPHACQKEMESVGEGKTETVRSGYWYLRLPLFVICYLLFLILCVGARSPRAIEKRGRD